MYHWSDEPTKKSSWFAHPPVFFFGLENASKRAVRSIGCKGHALKGKQRQQNPDMNHEPLNHEIWSNYSDLTRVLGPQMVVKSQGNGTPYFRES